MSASEIEALSKRVRELEAIVASKDEQIRALAREVPQGVGGRKFERIGADRRDAAVPDGEERVQWPSAKVRETFIEFFKVKCGHTFWRSSPVVPHNDPTLLFTNSGMAQFKPVFLGVADPSTDMAKLKRAANTQKCIRAGGKHNDLDDVGRDVYHHTFFEMLGNWSFGDYFKKEAIDWAWELLTVVFGINKDRLYVTYFKGNADVPADLEARELWMRFLPENRVLPYGAKENFWEMGDTGPCGPCSEIHYDRIGGRDAAALVNADDPDVLEIWNLVFMQFNRKADGSLERLPACHVDTGMGFERLTSVLQNKRSNYDTDVFAPLFRATEAMAGVRPYAGKVGKEDAENIDMAYRVVADHIRTLSFAIADGAFPSSEGRGYVLRRILRRAVRYSSDVLKMPQGSFSKLVATCVQCFREFFPELGEKEQLIYEVLLDEEETFSKTLSRGMERFRKEADKLQANGETEVPAKLTFFLYEAMGFPFDLTEILAKERSMYVSKDKFEEKMKEHVERSKGKGSAEAAGLPKMEAKETSHLENAGVLATGADEMYTWDKDLAGCKVMAIWNGDKFVDSAELGDGGKTLGFVLDKSNFYYESGGQLADTGLLVLQNDPSLQVEVSDAKGYKGYIVHVGSVTRNDKDDDIPLGTVTTIKVGDLVTCKVDYKRRRDLAKNHTSTHLLNFALRKVLATEVMQAGSVVTAERLRFDFNAQKQLTVEQLIDIEKEVRKQIRESKPVHAKVVPLADAYRISTLRAVFAETYPDPVRVISCGPTVEELLADPLNEKWSEFSVELCGGTHLQKTGEARAFSIVQETAVAKGVRRVICVTGDAAATAASDAEALRFRVGEANKLKGAKLEAEVKDIQQVLTTALISTADKHDLNVACETLMRQLISLQKEEEKVSVEKVFAEIKAAEESGRKFAIVQLEPGLANAGKVNGGVSGKFKKTPCTIPYMLAQPEGSSVWFVAVVPKETSAKYSAKDWVEQAGAMCEVQGGGSPQQFNGKGTNPDNLEKCIRTAELLARTGFA